MQKNLRFVYFYFIFNLVLIPMSQAAPWTCKGLLKTPTVALYLNDIMDQHWIPEGIDLDAFLRFRKTLAPELSDSHQLTEMLERSPLFKRALTVFISSLDPQTILTPNSTSLQVSNQLSKVLYNDNLPRTQAASEISIFIQESQHRAFTQFSLEELNLLTVEKKLSILAAELEKELRKRWYDTANDETVYSWIMADKSTATTTSLWGNIPENTPTEIYMSPENAPNVAAMLASKRKAPLIQAGEIFRDNFRIALEFFEENSYRNLKDKFDVMHSLKNKGAMDDINQLLQPFLSPRSDAEILNMGYVKETLEVFARILNSAQFFAAFKEFQDSYVNACETLIELSAHSRLTPAENRKLSQIAEELIIPYSIDLIEIGLNYSHPHEYRYRPLLLEMQRLNGRLTREIIPVGLLLNFESPTSESGLIIRP